MIINEYDLALALKNKQVLLPIGFKLSGEYPYHIASIANAVKQNNGSLAIFDYEASKRENRVLGFIRPSAKISREYKSRYYSQLSNRFGTCLSFAREVSLSKNIQNIIDEIENLEQVKKINDELYYSIKSIWMSRNLITLKDRKLSTSEVRLLKRDVESYFKTCEKINIALIELKVNLVIVLNGRTPEEVAIKHTAKRYNLEHFFFERGFRRKNRLFFQEFQTQDTKAMNNYFAKTMNSFSSSDLDIAEKWASDWLAEQENSILANPFIAFANKSAHLSNLPSGGDLVPVFTSSIDERFSNLGIDLNQWESQTQALVAISKRISSLGFATAVRIHPNTGWKSWRELIELVAALSKEKLAYFLPWENISSYELLERAPFIVTWGSTLALEGTARGVPTFNLGFSRFDDLIDLEIVSGLTIKDWFPNLGKKPNRKKSLLAIYVSRHFGLKLERQEWVSTLTLKENRVLDNGVIRNLFINPYVDFVKCLLFPLNRRPYDIYFILKRLLGKRVSDVIMLKFLTILVSRYE